MNCLGETQKIAEIFKLTYFVLKYFIAFGESFTEVNLGKSNALSKVKHLVSYRVGIKSGVSDSRVQAVS